MAAYGFLLSGIYLLEIAQHWDYMKFDGELSVRGVCILISFVIFLTLLMPTEGDTRASILTFLHVSFFMPSAVYVSFSQTIYTHHIALIGSIIIITSVSMLKIRELYYELLTISYLNIVLLFFVILALSAQAYFGGIGNFNLDIERVYEFRRETSDNLPVIFGYVYSNVSTVILPVLISLSLLKNNYLILVFSLFACIMLFGMSHHKSVLFGPIFVVFIFYFFQKTRNIYYIIIPFIVMSLLFCLEIYQFRFSSESSEIPYVTSLIARRLMFVPPMLDGLYLEFFSANPKYYWSTSSIASWALESPYQMSAPFIIGYEFFSDMETSSNTGLIGSGFSNAGLVGVALYSILGGAIISYLNMHGRRLGMPLVTAISISVVYSIVTSTDIVTAVLTHGLLMLVVILIFVPSDRFEAR